MNCSAAEVRLREAMRELEQLGLHRIDECLTLCLAATLERCIRQFKTRRSEGLRVSLAWLAAAIRNGGDWWADGMPNDDELRALLEATER